VYNFTDTHFIDTTARLAAVEHSKPVCFSDRNSASSGYVADKEAPPPRSVKHQKQRPHMMDKKIDSTTTNQAIIYWGPSGIQKYGSAYPTTRSTLYEPTDREELLLGSCDERAFTKAQLTTQLHVNMLLKKENVGSLSGYDDDYHKCLTRVKSDQKKDGKPLETKWRSVQVMGELMTLHDIVLYEWACQTCKVNNFYPAACHVDGNKSKEPEQMMYMPGASDTTPAYLFFPEYGFALVSNPGRTVAFSDLTRVYHVADRLRGGGNYFSGSGYKKKKKDGEGEDEGEDEDEGAI